MLLNVPYRVATMMIILNSSESLSSKIYFALPSQKSSLDCFYGSNP